MLKKKTCHPTRALRVPKFRDLFFNRPRFCAYGDSSDCLGRSMIEMLGVLAIIGVLSAAGLAGYSKAMQKNRVNKLKGQIQMIVTNLITSFQNEHDYSALGTDKTTATNTAVRLKAIPYEMVQSDGSVLNPFKGNVYVRAVEFDGVANAAFTIDIEGLPKEVAVSLAVDPGNDSNHVLQYIKVNNN